MVDGGDVANAFDQLRPTLVAQALDYANTHAQIITAMLREYRELVCQPMFHGVCVSRKIPFTKSGRQGGVETSYQWNLVMYMVLIPLVVSWRERGFGLLLDTYRRYCQLVWADNLWLLSA